MAFQLYEPAVLKACDAEFGTALLVTVTGVPTGVAVPAHVDPAKKL